MPNTVENLNAQTVIPANGTNPRTLYEHQVEALKALNAINKKHDFRTLLVLPTGGGKTLTAVYWLLQNAVDQGKKILWIAHRHLLLEQAADTFINNAYTSIMINHTTFRYRIISGMHDKPVHIKNDDNILIVSKESINRSLERLDSWLKNEDVFLVIDEAHHAVAKTYRKTIKYVEEHSKSMQLLGLTATPFRTSEKEKGALYQIFTDDIVYKIDLKTLIDRHILAYPTFVDGCETGVELGDMVGLKNIQEIENFDALPKNIQDFLQENNERNSFIVDHYVKNKEKYGKTIVFAINKTNAFALNALFRKNKIRSDYIVSDVRDAALGITISSKENEEKIKQYRDGKLDVLINVNILTEGTDLPQTHTVFLTRPTISRVFMTQMVGRALRGEKAGGTTDAYIVPFIDDWNGKIAWVNPQSLFKDEYEPQDTPAKKQQSELRMISISKIEEFAAILNEGIDTSALEQIEMIERIPVGYYMFSTLEWNHQILIYNSTQSSYQALISDLPQIMELYKIEEETIPDDVLSEMTDYCMEQYFDEAMVPACQRSDVEHLLLFFAQKAVDPLFVPLDDIVRKKLDVSDIAKKFEDEAMTGRERKAYLDSLWNAEDSVYKIYYSSPYIFKRMVDIEMDKLDGYMDTEYSRPQTQAELRKLEDLKLEDIIRQYPNIGIPLKMKVFDKARNSDGDYVCAGCKKTFDSRQYLHVDHIKPMGAKGYQEEYNIRYNSDTTIHLNVTIGNDSAFICQTPEIYKQIIAIERMDKAVDAVANTLPQLAISQFTSKCLIDEILLTNNIEGVHSTRKEIGEILQDLSTRDKRNRFVGLVAKYAALEDNQTMTFKTCQDIRKVYDDIFYEEIKATDPENLPDGEMFRKSGVEVQSATQKVIHKGLSPESKIIDTMNQSLTVLNNDDIDIFIRIAVFHYLFGYIHPFYDGNGRTSRFISSYLLSRQLNPLIGYRLSYTVKENISKYYKAFDVCNDQHNKAELTPFVEMFLNILEISLQQLLETLEEKKYKWIYYCQRVGSLPNAKKNDIAHLYELLIQAALFSNIGISREELLNELKLSENTLRSRLRMIPDKLLIENRQKGRKYYLLDLDEADKLFEES